MREYLEKVLQPAKIELKELTDRITSKINTENLREALEGSKKKRTHRKIELNKISKLVI